VTSGTAMTSNRVAINDLVADSGWQWISKLVRVGGVIKNLVILLLIPIATATADKYWLKVGQVIISRMS
jgi:hypothetical protein